MVSAHGATNLFCRGQQPLSGSTLAGVTAHGEMQELRRGQEGGARDLRREGQEEPVGKSLQEPKSSERFIGSRSNRHLVVEDKRLEIEDSVLPSLRSVPSRNADALPSEFKFELTTILSLECVDVQLRFVTDDHCCFPFVQYM